MNDELDFLFRPWSISGSQTGNTRALDLQEFKGLGGKCDCSGTGNAPEPVPIAFGVRHDVNLGCVKCPCMSGSTIETIMTGLFACKIECIVNSTLGT